MDKNPSDFTSERNNAGFYDALVIWEDCAQQKNKVINCFHWPKADSAMSQKKGSSHHSSADH